MSVKTIFKTLIGTIVLIVVSSMIIEFFNINVTSAMLSQYTRLAVKQSCVLFSQETYRNADPYSGYTGAVNQKILYADDGSNYSTYTDEDGHLLNMSAFYIGNTEKEVWENLYINNDDFKNGLTEINSEIALQVLGNYNKKISPNTNEQIAARIPELASLTLMSTSSGGVALPPLPSGYWDLPESNIQLINYNNASRAQTYLSNRYTPINVGIPYMDEKVTSKMLQWHLTQLLANNNPASIQRAEGASIGGTGIYDYYVNFRGFAVYTRGAQVTGYKYHICDLNTSEGRDKLKNLTGMDATGATTGQGLKYKKFVEGTSTPYINSEAHEKISNNLVFVVEVEYEVPVTYIGITPLKSIFNFVFNEGTGVERAGGYDGVAGTLPSQTYNTTAGLLKNNTDPDAKLATGKVYYTLVR